MIKQHTRPIYTTTDGIEFLNLDEAITNESQFVFGKIKMLLPSEMFTRELTRFIMKNGDKFIDILKLNQSLQDVVRENKKTNKELNQ